MLCSFSAKGCEGKSNPLDAAQRAPVRWERGALMRVNMVPEPRTEPGGERDPGKAATGAPVKASGV